MPLWFERALVVVAPQDSGKSVQLRSMFRDSRLGSEGEVPTAAEKPKLRESYYISNERKLYLRLTSPHEYGDTLQRFVEKVRDRTNSGRWCFAGALQPDAFGQMPDVVETIQGFASALSPERIRLVFLSPTRHGHNLDDYSGGRDLCHELLQIPTVEVALVDAREREVNGLFLADFFDFT